MLFLEARRRDPRSPAARYFLGSRYLQTHRIPEGLKEIAFLSRAGGGRRCAVRPGAGRICALARRGAAAQALFASSPKTEDAVLTHLANDPSNADLILKLVSPAHRSASQTAPAWHAVLVQKLVEKGQYARAYSIRGSAAPRRRFRFNWTFNSGKAGVAEPSANGLKIVYYGREDAVLASQLLLLPAGSYRLASPVDVAGSVTGLAWSLTCQGGKQRIAALAITAPAAAQTRFVVPAGGCSA